MTLALPSESRAIRLFPHTCRTVRIAMFCGLVLYYGVIPLEFLATGAYVIKNDFMDTELAARSLIDGPTVVFLAFLGFWLGTRPLSLINRNVMIRPSDLGSCASRIAVILIVVFAMLATRTSIFLKATDVEMAATSDSDYGVASNSLVLTAAAAAAGVAAMSFALNPATRPRSALWLVLVLMLGGLGLRLGDKDPMGAAVFMGIASFALWLRGHFLPTIVACSLCVAGLLALSAASMVKFLLFGIAPDLSRLLTRPSSSDPGGAFAIMVTSMDCSVPLGMPGYNALAAISNDLGSSVPQWIWSGRPQPPGASLASFLMGSTYVEGYGVGYSPYVDLYCALGPVGIILAGLIIGWAVTLLLRIAAYVDSSGRLLAVCAMISFYVIVVCQRLSLMGSLKQLIYYNAATITAFLIVVGFVRVRRAMFVSRHGRELRRQ